MQVVLKGNWPSALTAGILLLSRSRSFGIPISVQLMGEPGLEGAVFGPMVVQAHVLASCGVGRDLGEGALVVVPGPAVDPVLLCLERDGQGPWFEVDSSGEGIHPATKAFVRLARDRRPEARHASKLLRRFFEALGVPAEPAVLDLLFGAPAPPLTRLALAVRAGRAMTEGGGREIMDWFVGGSSRLDVLPPTGGEIMEAWESGALESQLELLHSRARIQVEDLLEAMATLARDDGGRDLEILTGFGEIAEYLLVLPKQGILPPLDATADAVAVGLSRVLGAPPAGSNAQASLEEIFRFLGGRFTDHSPFPIQLRDDPPPEGRVDRWKWFLENVCEAAEHAEGLWKMVTDPVS
jgi:hypothetical protein